MRLFEMRWDSLDLCWSHKKRENLRSCSGQWSSLDCANQCLATKKRDRDRPSWAGLSPSSSSNQHSGSQQLLFLTIRRSWPRRAGNAVPPQNGKKIITLFYRQDVLVTSSSEIFHLRKDRAYLPWPKVMPSDVFHQHPVEFTMKILGKFWLLIKFHLQESFILFVWPRSDYGLAFELTEGSLQKKNIA